LLRLLSARLAGVAGPGKEKMRGKWRAGGASRSAEGARIGLPIKAAKKRLAPAYAKAAAGNLRRFAA
jgi:hypothetical protein